MPQELHLLTPGDGTDALIRLGRAHPAALLVSVGELSLAQQHWPIPSPKFQAHLAGRLTTAAHDQRRLSELVARHRVDRLHTWGPAAAEVVSRWLAVGADAVDAMRALLAWPPRWPSRQTVAQPEWFASDLPADWRAPRLGREPTQLYAAGPVSRELSLAPLDARPAARARLGIPAMVPVVLLATAHRRRDELLTGVWAASVAAQVHPQLWLIGVGHGPLLSEWRTLLGCGGIAERTRHLPRLTDWPTALAASDVLLETAVADSSSAALQFGVAVGLPTVVADSPARRATLGESAHYFPPGEAREAAAGIHAVLSARAGRVASAANATG